MSSLEFDLIERFFKPLSFTLPNDLGIGDDGAVLQCLENHQLVVVTDTLISGVHFPESTSPFDIAWKALAVNLSDLAAMGAKPAFYSLALTLSDECNNAEWLRSFSKGLKSLAGQFNLPLIGGDTTRGNLSITITAHGWVESGCALLRSSACVGDDIYVSGYLGEGGLGLVNELQNLTKQEIGFSQTAKDKLNRPQPRIKLGRELLTQQLSTCAIDVSDGFLQDLTHILKASDLYAEVYLPSFPRSKKVKDWQEKQNNVLFSVISGDDYELCFTASVNKRSDIKQLSESLKLPLTRVGKMQGLKKYSVKDPLILLDSKKEKIPINFKKMGYQHF